MASRLSSFTAGQRPKRAYLNRATRFLFAEFDKGLSSPYIVLSTGALLSLVGWKLFDRLITPCRETNAVWRRPYSRVPLSDAHNSFWGFNTDSSDWRGVPSGRHDAVSMTDSVEDALRRPVLLDSATSELHAANGESLGLVCMEIPEYDATLRDDAVFRSVHYVHGMTHHSPPSASHSVKTTPPTREATVDANADVNNTSYLARMPARGLALVHGMTKCKALTSLNNCVPYAGHLESEYARKMMLALGPVHILRDAAKTFLPTRFTPSKEVSLSALVCGLHSGELPRWLSRAFPNFDVDVVERDGALARLCRRYLGFQESSNLHLFVADPLEFVRRTAVPDVGRRYDLILLDNMDGDGRLPTPFVRLEFINSVRNSLTQSGCVVAALPNRDGAFLYNAVQNWRMAFAGRAVLLIHCVTSPQTLLMTFQDDAERGKANFGTVANVDEFRDVLRANLVHYGPERVPFDLLSEVSRENFRVLRPGAVYDPDAFLPIGHPETVRRARHGMESPNGGGWSARLRRWSASWLTPTQRTDLGRMNS